MSVGSFDVSVDNGDYSEQEDVPELHNDPAQADALSTLTRKATVVDIDRRTLDSCGLFLNGPLVAGTRASTRTL